MKQRIVCSGTFDTIHKGHIEYLRASKALRENSELIVIVARDKNSALIKGKETINKEDVRLEKIKALDFVDEAVLGFKDKSKIIDRVVSLKPDVLALGHDQWAKEEWLKEEFSKRNLEIDIVRMQRFDK